MPREQYTLEQKEKLGRLSEKYKKEYDDLLEEKSKYLMFGIKKEGEMCHRRLLNQVADI